MVGSAPSIQQNVAVHFLARDQFSGPLAIMAGALATFSGAAIKMAADFDLAFARVNSLLPQNAQQLEHFKGEVLNLSKALGVDAVDAMNGLYEAVSAGIPKENGITFIETATKAAIAGLTNTKVAVDGLTSAINAFRIPAEQVNSVADAFFQAVNIGKQTFEELSAAMYIAAPIASNTGAALNELLAAETSLTKSGATASVAMTQVRSALTALNKPSENLTNILNKMGFESGQAAIKALGLQGTFEGIRQTADSMNLPLSRVFGRVEAVNAVLGLTGPNAQSARKDLESLTNSAGAMTSAFQDIDATPARDFQRAIAELKIAFIDLGTDALPILTALAETIGTIAKAFDALPDPLQGSLLTFASLTAAVLLAIAVYSKMASSLATISRHFLISANAANTAAAATDNAARAAAGYQFLNRPGRAPGAPGGGVLLTGAGAASVYGLGAVAAITSIDAALQAFTGKGVWERLFGSGGAENTKRLQEAEKSLQRIRDLTDDTGRQKLLKEQEIDEATQKLIEFQKVLEDINKANEGQKDSPLGSLDVTGKQREALKDFSDQVKEVSSSLLVFFGTGKELVDEMNRLQQSMPTEAFQALLENTQLAEAYSKAYQAQLKLEIAEQQKKVPLDRDSSEAVLSFGAAHVEATDKIVAASRAIDDEADSMKVLDDALDSLLSRFDDLNPAVAANNVLIEQAKLQIAQIENNARNADGSLRDLSKTEQDQVDDLNAYIESLERSNAVTAQYKPIIEALRTSIEALGKPIGVTDRGFKEMIVTLENSSQQAPDVVNALTLLQQALDGTNPDRAVQALVGLTQQLGATSENWKTIAKNIPAEFWQKLVDGINNPEAAATALGILKSLLGSALKVDLSGMGRAAANSYWAGFLSGMSSQGGSGSYIDENTAYNLFGPGSSAAEQIANAGEQLGATLPEHVWAGAHDGFAAGGGGGAGAEEAAKTAIDGFLATFEDTFRQFSLEKEFGDLGGGLMDALAESIDTNSEQAGSAVADALRAIMDRLNEVNPEGAAAWGETLAAAIARAIQERTPEAVQAVADLVNQIKGQLYDLQSVINDAVSALDDLGSGLETALKNKYTAERNAEVDRLQGELDKIREERDQKLKEIQDSQNASGGSSGGGGGGSKPSDRRLRESEEELKILRDAYEEKRKLIQREVQDRVNAYNDQVKALEKSLDEMDRAEEEHDHFKTLEDLEKEKRRAKTSFGRWQAQQKIDEENRRYELLLQRQGIQDRIQSLKDLIDAEKRYGDQRLQVLEDNFDAESAVLQAAIDKEKAAYDAAREAASSSYSERTASANSYYSTVKKQIDDTYDKLIDEKEKEIQATKDKYDAMLDEQNIFNEALIILLGGGMDEALGLIEQYNPSWALASLGIGRALVQGFNDSLPSIAQAVNAIIDIVNKAREAQDLPLIPHVNAPSPINPPESSGGGGTGGHTGPPPIGTDYRGKIKPGWNLVTVDQTSNSAVFGPGAQVYSVGPTGQPDQLIGPGTPIRPGTAVWVNSPNGYAQGTRFSRGGLALVGERGPELLQLPQGSQVTSNSNFENLLSLIRQLIQNWSTGGNGGNSTPIQVIIGGQVFEDFVVRSVTRASRRTI